MGLRRNRSSLVGVGTLASLVTLTAMALPAIRLPTAPVIERPETYAHLAPVFEPIDSLAAKAEMSYDFYEHGAIYIATVRNEKKIVEHEYFFRMCYGETRTEAQMVFHRSMDAYFLREGDMIKPYGHATEKQSLFQQQDPVLRQELLELLVKGCTGYRVKAPDLSIAKLI